ncbi:MAG: protein-disulfide reductase DsbD N-terminal domain-containing protein [Rudaea sp.]
MPLRTLVLGLALAVTGAYAQGPAGLGPKLLPPEEAFRLSARALDASTLEARFDVADGYYLYRDKMRFSTEPVPAEPAVLPLGKTKHDPFFGDVETYRDVVVVRVPLAKPAAGQTLTLHADSQGCADVGVCYPPTPQQVRLVVPSSGRAGEFVEPARKGWFK